MIVYTGRFTDEDPEPAEQEAIEEQPHTWDEADEGDRRYDLWAEQQMEDRHSFPDNEDRLLTRIAPQGEDDMEMARRRAMIRKKAA